MQDLNIAPGPDALDELDLALVHALQLAPRAPWTDLAPVLDAAPATLARRWRHMQSVGAAWMTCHFGLPPGRTAPGGSVAVVEATVAPGRIPAVAATLARHPELINIEHLTGGRDLLLTAVGGDAGRLARYLQVQLPSVPGITGMRVQIPRHLYKDTGAWRLRALDRDQRQRLAELARPSGPPTPPYPMDSVDRAIITALGPDGRLTTAELGRRLDINSVTAARRLSRLMSAGYARFRAEVARSLTGWPITATWWLRVPPAEIDATANEIATMGDVRLCMSLTGTANLMVVMWVRHPADTGTVEAEWARRFPRLDVLDSAITLQVIKNMCRLLDTDGRSIGYVPFELTERPLPEDTP